MPTMPTRLTRAELEAKYILQESKLQRHWKNPLDDDWAFVKEMSDKELEERTKEARGQLHFEWGYSVFAVVAAIIFGLFISRWF